MNKRISDEELSARLGLFMANIVSNDSVDNIVIITNRGDRVGLHHDGKNGASLKTANAIVEQIYKRREKFSGGGVPSTE